MYKILVFLVMSALTLVSFSQDNERATSGSDSLNDQLVSDIEYADLGYLWSGAESQDARLGFVGENYQRLQVHFISVIKNYDNPFEYFLYGKTNTDNHICSFQGSLVITEAGVIPDETHPGLTQGLCQRELRHV